ncbi:MULTISPECIES: hypothetical protein [unclassified Nostoc]|nr:MULTISPECIES: hypothetical protein [unclassified Nostoc]
MIAESAMGEAPPEAIAIEHSKAKIKREHPKCAKTLIALIP